MTDKELRAAIEAIVFAASDTVSINDLVSALPDATRESVEAAAEDLRVAIEENFGGFILESVAGGFRLATRPEMDPHLRKFFSRRNETRLSMAALETLAIVAYRQPITSPEVAEIRGVNSSGVLRTLLERKLIRIAGRKNVVGSPFLYRTTRDFLVHFGLQTIQDLPKLDEFAEILGESVQDELFGGPIDDTGDVDAASSAAESEASEDESPIPETADESREPDAILALDPAERHPGTDDESGDTEPSDDAETSSGIAPDERDVDAGRE